MLWVKRGGELWQSMHKKTGETFEDVSAWVGSSSCRNTLNRIHKELEKDLKELCHEIQPN